MVYQFFISLIFFFILVIFTIYLITIKKKAKQSLEEKEQLLQNLSASAGEKIELESILQAIEDGVIITDLKNHIQLVSSKAASILRSDINTLKGKDINQILPTTFLTDKINSNYTTDLQLQNGQIITAKLNSLPIISQEVHKGTVYTIHDKTQEKEFEEMKFDFASFGAHQLRTPLTAIKGYMFMLSKTVIPKINDQEKTFFSKTTRGVERLSSLVEYLINVTKTSGNSIHLQLQPSSVDKIIIETISEMEHFAAQKGITFFYEQPKTPLPIIMIDPYLINSVINNLISNAIEHSQTKRIDIRAQLKDNQIVVDIQDYGVGIPSFAVSHLFTKFYRVPNNLIHSTQGNGLGLYISKTIVDAHHGQIWVNTLPGKGTTLSFSVPTTLKA